MSMGAAQMQHQMYSDLQDILGDEYKLIEGSLADLMPTNRPAPFNFVGEVQAPGEKVSEGEASKERLAEQ